MLGERSADLVDTGAAFKELGAIIGPQGVAFFSRAKSLRSRAQSLRRRAQASGLGRKLCADRLSLWGVGQQAGMSGAVLKRCVQRSEAGFATPPLRFCAKSQHPIWHKT
jgi:hypothetical protein